MISLNLTASGTEQTLIKDYLEQNASEVLAKKINNGVWTEKDGIKLLNKKSLDGFMAYAEAEARALAEKGARYTCVEDKVVFGWAIHYFEEDSIEGVLYLEDGTEYKPTPKPTPKKVETVKTEPKKKKPVVESGQQSMFDLFEIATVETTVESEEETEENEEVAEEAVIESAEEPVEEPSISPLYQTYLDYQKEFGEEAIILLRVGDFYEVFGEWAKRIAEHAEMTLVSRDFGLSERVPMIGVPYHKIDIYLEKFTELAAVAVCQNDKTATLVPQKQIDYSNVDKSTGEVLEVKLKPEQEECLEILRELFGNELEVLL